MNEINKRFNIGMSIQDKYNSKTINIIRNDWNNYYNQYLKINNNQGVKTMLKKIYNKINNMLEKVGYHFVGYKVDIEKNQDDIRAIREYKVGAYDFGQLKNELNARIDMIENNHNGLAKDFNDYTTLDTHHEDNAKTSLLNTPFKITRVLDELIKPSCDVDDNILMLVNIINSITEAKVNNACLIVQYGEDITLNKVPYSKYSMKEILEHYIKNNDNTTFLDGSKYTSSLYVLKQIAKILAPYDNDGININVDDVVDDINDIFNGFNNIYNDVCDDVDNINLGN